MTRENSHAGFGDIGRRIDPSEPMVDVVFVAHVTECTQVNRVTVRTLPANSFDWFVLTGITLYPIVRDSFKEHTTR